MEKPKSGRAALDSAESGGCAVTPDRAAALVEPLDSAAAGVVLAEMHPNLAAPVLACMRPGSASVALASMAPDDRVDVPEQVHPQAA